MLMPMPQKLMRFPKKYMISSREERPVSSLTRCTKQLDMSPARAEQTMKPITVYGLSLKGKGSRRQLQSIATEARMTTAQKLVRRYFLYTFESFTATISQSELSLLIESCLWDWPPPENESNSFPSPDFFDTEMLSYPVPTSYCLTFFYGRLNSSLSSFRREAVSQLILSE